jgi:hypothetical protein
LKTEGGRVKDETEFSIPETGEMPSGEREVLWERI